jgi:hypothetical protein
VAKQGYLAPNDHGGAGGQVAFSYCRSLYALALMFPPKLSSHPGTHLVLREELAHAGAQHRVGGRVHAQLGRRREHQRLGGRGRSTQQRLQQAVQSVGVRGGSQRVAPLA